MKIIRDIDLIKKELSLCKSNDKSLGFIPTMGYLHDGHLSLVKKAKKNNDIVVVSIYVNPTQFLPGEDLDTYPRDEERDIKLLEDLDVDILFLPKSEEMYPSDYITYVEPTGIIADSLCSKSRPGHFKGVDTIVLKLFNIIKPNDAYFGMKDAQQVSVIKAMVRDLNLDINIKTIDIIREDDGLAMSSRNKRLTLEHRKDALILFKSLELAIEKIKFGEKSADVIKKIIETTISSVSSAVIDYVEIVDFKSFKKVDVVKDNTLIAVAVKFGNVRLIDNKLYVEK